MLRPVDGVMQAARFYAAGDVRVERVPRPAEPGPGEVLLRIVAAGICGSDALEYRAGPVLATPPVTLGHEFAGEVVAVGPEVESLAVGALVACGAGMSCGECEPCRSGRTNLCTSYATIGFHRDGGLAELCLAPADICIEVDLPPRVAALAQPMAIAVHAMRRGRVAVGEEVLIIGAGGIGSFLTYALTERGACVSVVDLDEHRLEVASALGARRAISSLPEPLTASVVFEVSGAKAPLEHAVAALPRGGRVVVVGVQKEPPAVDFRRVALDELELIGTVAHVCKEDLPEAVRLLASRESWDDVAPAVIALQDLIKGGLRPLAEGTSSQIKTLIDPCSNAA
jgi:(R,R)-butanediol dehydrogenase / meso-butanediol dehydrogenase / diacetyl reductase